MTLRFVFYDRERKKDILVTVWNERTCEIAERDADRPGAVWGRPAYPVRTDHTIDPEPPPVIVPDLPSNPEDPF